jgi:hypothetical protein
MNRIITLFIFLIFTGDLKAQPDVYIGSEVAWSADIFKHTDRGGYLRKAPINSAFWGLNVRYHFLKNLFLESGVYGRPYKIGVGFVNGNYATATDRVAVIFPVRIGARLSFFKGAVSLTPVTGIALAMTNPGDPFTFEGTLSNDGTKIAYEFTPQYAAQTFALVQTGIGIDIRIMKQGLITLNTNLYSGLTKIMIEHIKYKVNTDAQRTATATSRGSFYTIGIGYRHNLNYQF